MMITMMNWIKLTSELIPAAVATTSKHDTWSSNNLIKSSLNIVKQIFRCSAVVLNFISKTMQPLQSIAHKYAAVTGTAS